MWRGDGTDRGHFGDGSSKNALPQVGSCSQLPLQPSTTSLLSQTGCSEAGKCGWKPASVPAKQTLRCSINLNPNWEILGKVGKGTLHPARQHEETTYPHALAALGYQGWGVIPGVPPPDPVVPISGTGCSTGQVRRDTGREKNNMGASAGCSGVMLLPLPTSPQNRPPTPTKVMVRAGKDSAAHQPWGQGVGGMSPVWASPRSNWESWEPPWLVQWAQGRRMWCRGGRCGWAGLGVEGGVMPEDVLGEKRSRKGKAGAGERAEEGGQPPLNPAAPPPSHPRPQARQMWECRDQHALLTC